MIACLILWAALSADTVGVDSVEYGFRISITERSDTTRYQRVIFIDGDGALRGLPGFRVQRGRGSHNIVGFWRGEPDTRWFVIPPVDTVWIKETPEPIEIPTDRVYDARERR